MIRSIRIQSDGLARNTIVSTDSHELMRCVSDASLFVHDGLWYARLTVGLGEFHVDGAVPVCSQCGDQIKAVATPAAPGEAPLSRFQRLVLRLLLAIGSRQQSGWVDLVAEVERELAR